jgi:hypothetical protein
MKGEPNKDRPSGKICAKYRQSGVGEEVRVNEY